MSLARVAFRPVVRSIRFGSTGHHAPNHGATLPDMTKWEPQTPNGPVHDGWATAVSTISGVLEMSDVCIIDGLN